MSLSALREPSSYGEGNVSKQQQRPKVKRDHVKFTRILIGILCSCVDGKTHAYGVVITTHYVAARFLNVFRPRHVVQIIEISSSANIMVRFLLKWCDSSAGLHWVQKWAHQKLRSQLDGCMLSFHHAMGLSWLLLDKAASTMNSIIEARVIESIRAH
ncbi:hypothetical protein K505DRAFT_417258 [Melanomma pulvis-pyrius CBS 109.77]|uniref:Uncharacterized protein n=1 Tax=Melanomma pulvis-pyrius CBS 109.77 TaxID=1314802 RepID=A0A6A6XE90_9PLEO|nr:hypothetical protein K505DRAFT_417258 [Melanomma pulvis-pyrius CBS 109.77]